MIYFKLACAIFLWGLTFLFTKYALSDVSLVTLVFSRCILGLATVSLFLREFKWLKQITKTQWLKFALLGFIGLIVQQSVQGYAITHTSTNHAGWLIALSPIFVAFLMVVFFKEKLPKDKMMGFLICAFGVILIFISKQTFTDGTSMNTLKGDIIFICTAINWAFYVIPMSIWFKNMPNLRATFCILLAATLILLPVEILSGSYKDFMYLHPKSLASLIYLGVCCSGFALIFYNEGIEKIGASRASAFLYLQPFVTMIFGFIILGEIINKETFIGGALILCGLYLINVQRKHIKKFMITLIRYFRV
ncbi:drug/metabolite transporter (DMT)-like permease [Elusimicrobium posterum]|uniref:DMT family transporter n=1 Tax=Elusimicrobium posterum TaxID=3116653 RepID=UPI003C75A77C